MDEGRTTNVGGCDVILGGRHNRAMMICNKNGPPSHVLCGGAKTVVREKMVSRTLMYIVGRDYHAVNGRCDRTMRMEGQIENGGCYICSGRTITV